MLMRSTVSKKPMGHAQKMETKEAVFRTRKRILKYLVQGYLRQEGYYHTAETFASEAGVTPDYELCDNIDLDIILQEYCSYYLIKFNKQPQFCRLAPEQAAVRPPPRKVPPEKPAKKVVEEEPDLPAALAVTKLLPDDSSTEDGTILPVDRKPLAGFVSNCSAEKRQLAELVYQDIIRPTGVNWDDVKGLAEAKGLLMEAVVYPVRYPSMFTGLLSPWRGVLLHGPPGTGKTLLARAAAASSHCTFFNVSCSTLVNKWRGDSEKIVKVLFELASYYAPSIVFMDEAESVCGAGGAAEHEASRRLRAQLLAELDGAARRDGAVLLLANSNMPWEIDPAMLRRLEKRIYIPLPDTDTRAELFKMYLDTDTIEVVPKVDYSALAAGTEGYSGSDIRLVCKEALMTAVRKKLSHMDGKGPTYSRRDKIALADVWAAIEKTKPVSKNLARKHEEWQRQMGCS